MCLEDVLYPLILGIVFFWKVSRSSPAYSQSIRLKNLSHNKWNKYHSNATLCRAEDFIVLRETRDNSPLFPSHSAPFFPFIFIVDREFTANEIQTDFLSCTINMFFIAFAPSGTSSSSTATGTVDAFVDGERNVSDFSRNEHGLFRKRRRWRSFFHFSDGFLLLAAFDYRCIGNPSGV